MTQKNTFDILKYGSMYPDKVRRIIDKYYESDRIDSYKGKWIKAEIEGTSESEYCVTHFYKLWVYYDIDQIKTLIAFIPQFIENFPVSRWKQVSMIIINIDVTDMAELDVYVEFGDQLELLEMMGRMEEHRLNFPDEQQKE